MPNISTPTSSLHGERAIISRWARYLRQPARFVVVGASNTALSYVTYCVCLHFGAAVWLANLIGWVFGMCASFLAQRSFVFANREPGTFGRFLFTALTIYAVQTFMIELLVVHGYDAALAGVLVLPGQVVVSYVAQKYFVFGAMGRRARDDSPGPGR